MTLDELAPGDRARVLTLEGEDEAVERLMEMGLVEGTTLEVIRFAPLGDPLEIAARGYRLTLRRAEARGIQIERL